MRETVKHVTKTDVSLSRIADALETLVDAYAGPVVQVDNTPEMDEQIRKAIDNHVGKIAYHFQKLLSEKTNWGRNEVYYKFSEAVEDSK